MWRFLPLAPWAPRTHTFARSLGSALATIGTTGACLYPFYDHGEHTFSLDKLRKLFDPK